MRPELFINFLITNLDNVVYSSWKKFYGKRNIWAQFLAYSNNLQNPTANENQGRNVLKFRWPIKRKDRTTKIHAGATLVQAWIYPFISRTALSIA
jgi:hypothetical protein